ncbi:MAG: hypothetical protein V1859_07005 [archaeon]
MLTPLALSLVFGAGILTQAVVLLGKKILKDYKMLLFGLAISLVGLTPGKHESNYNLYMHILFCFLYFAFLFSIYFKKEILPVIDERTLLLFNIILINLVATYLMIWRNFILLAITLPTLAVLYITFSVNKLNFASKLLLYIWFLIMNISLIIFKFSFGAMSFFFNEAEITSYSPIDIFLTGMVFLFLVSNAVYIFELIPIPGKHQSFSDRIKQLKEHICVLVSKYSDEQIKPWFGLFLIVILGGGFYLNFIFHIIPNEILMNFLIVFVTSFLLNIKN